MKILTKIGIIILMLTFLSGCYKEVDFVSLKSAAFSSTNANGNILLFVDVNNPNFYSIKIVESDLDIYINGSHLGKIEGTHDIKILGNEETIVEIPIKVGLTDIIFNIGNIGDLISNGDVELKVSGTITAKALFVKKTISIDEVSPLSLYD